MPQGRFRRLCSRCASAKIPFKFPILQSAPGSNLLGNPLKVVLWLVNEMKRQDKTLKAGDRLSLGSVGKLFPLKEPGKTYTYTLKGLPGGPVSTSVTVQ